MPKVLVLGIGNPLHGDDGVGPRVVRDLARRTRLPQVDFLDGGTGGPHLVGYLAGYAHLLVMDAMDAGLEPGTVWRLASEDLRRPGPALSLHQAGLADLLAVARLLGCLPATVIFGVQVGRLEWGTQLSPAVAARLPVLERLILGEIAAILGPYAGSLGPVLR